MMPVAQATGIFLRSVAVTRARVLRQCGLGVEMRNSGSAIVPILEREMRPCRKILTSPIH